MKASFNQLIHFSIDDVSGMFKWIYENKPRSIFEEPNFALLQLWNKKFGLIVDLYVFEEADNFNICSLQDEYWHELKENSGWIKMGWHQITLGEITASIDEQILSVNRLYDTVIKKADKGLMSAVTRLHRFEGSRELISHLNDKGVTYFLTSDRKEKTSYDLTEEQSELANADYCYIDEERHIYYIPTDLRLDAFCDGKTVDDYLIEAEEIINKKAFKERLEIFCHERVLRDIKGETEELFSQIPTIKKRLYFNAAACYGTDVYFTSLQNNFLYLLNGANRNVSIVKILSSANGWFKFSSIIPIDDELWMIPCEAWNIYVYNVRKNVLRVLDLQYKLPIKYKAHEHRKAIRYKKYIWLLPTKMNALVRINTENDEIIIYDNFPKGVAFDERIGMPFKCGNVIGNQLYLFADSCNHNLIVDLDTGAISIWNSLFRERFAYGISDEKIVVSPTYEGDPLAIYNVKTKTKRTIEVPPEAWIGAKRYAFWYPCKYGKYLYFMPHEARGILRFDTEIDELKLLKVPDFKYDSIRISGEFIGYDLVEFDEGALIISYMGAQCIQLDKNGDIVGLVDIFTSIDESKTLINYTNDNLLYESHDMSLANFIDGVSLYI